MGARTGGPAGTTLARLRYLTQPESKGRDRRAGVGRGKRARRGAAQQGRSCPGKHSAQRRRRAGGGFGAAMPEGARPRSGGGLRPIRPDVAGAEAKRSAEGVSPEA